MRRGAVLVALLVALVWANPARAVIGTIDNVPAATLLIPYFEVDVADATGVTTLIGIQNTSATAVLVHLTLWTDLGIPTFAFDVYLTGYDVQTINLRDVLVTGYLPVTASDGQDPTDNISPQGLFSQDINFASCGSYFPYVNPAVTAAKRAHLQAWHRGLASPSTGTCAGAPHSDQIARGYVTIDTVTQCYMGLDPPPGMGFPTDPGYFCTGGGCVASNQNVLTGDFFIVHPGNNFMESDLAVAIEASGSNPLTSTPGSYTFYGRSLNWSAADNREPLPNMWAARYLADASSYRVWRDPAVAPVVAGFTCGLLPPAFPLDQVQTVAFDSEENPLLLAGTWFPYSTLEIEVDAGGLPATDKQGFMYLNLNSTTSLGPPPGAFRQSWVTVKQNHQGRFSASWPALQMGNPAQAANQVLPVSE